jgi:hypothetical protein
MSSTDDERSLPDDLLAPDDEVADAEPDDAPGIGYAIDIRDRYERSHGWNFELSRRPLGAHSVQFR